MADPDALSEGPALAVGRQRELPRVQDAGQPQAPLRVLRAREGELVPRGSTLRAALARGQERREHPGIRLEPGEDKRRLGIGDVPVPAEPGGQRPRTADGEVPSIRPLDQDVTRPGSERPHPPPARHASAHDPPREGKRGDGLGARHADLDHEPLTAGLRARWSSSAPRLHPGRGRANLKPCAPTRITQI